MADPTPPSDDLEFGPSGYLPEKASKRARKIVLRAPLGVQWIVAAMVFGLVVLVAGLLFLRSSGPPDAPYVAVGTLPEIGDARLVADVDALVVTAGGPVQAFADATAQQLTYCAASRQVEAPDGRTWSLTGRGYGTASLGRHPLVVHDGMVYVDPTTTVPGPRPADDPRPPGC